MLNDLLLLLLLVLRSILLACSKTLKRLHDIMQLLFKVGVNLLAHWVRSLMVIDLIG